jgi:hypothetical protein
VGEPVLVHRTFAWWGNISYGRANVPGAPTNTGWSLKFFEQPRVRRFGWPASTPVSPSRRLVSVTRGIYNVSNQACTGSANGSQ